jgi:hypothetical protein
VRACVCVCHRSTGVATVLVCVVILQGSVVDRIVCIHTTNDSCVLDVGVWMPYDVVNKICPDV